LACDVVAPNSSAPLENIYIVVEDGGLSSMSLAVKNRLNQTNVDIITVCTSGEIATQRAVGVLDRMDHRAMGIEQEYGIGYSVSNVPSRPENAEGFLRRLDETGFDVGSIDQMRADDMPEVIAYALSRLIVDGATCDQPTSRGGFMVNGSRFYPDQLNPEYATPECTSVRSLVAHDLAGARWVEIGRQRLEAQLPGTRLTVTKQNHETASPLFALRSETWGTHENYLIPRALAPERLAWGLVPFLATRPLLVGAGGLIDRSLGFDEPDVVMVRSPKALATRCLMSSESADRRPFILLRAETHAGADWKRLQVPNADGNATPRGTWLKVGITALALRLVEEEVLGHEFELESPLDAVFEAGGVARDVDGNETRDTPVVLADGTHTTALALQERYADRVEQLMHRSGGSEEEWTLLEAWHNSIANLRSGTSQPGELAEWQLKNMVVARRCERAGVDFNTRHAVDVAEAFTSVDPRESLVARLVRGGSIDAVVSDAEIVQAMTTPPPTRAQTRSALIETAQQHGVLGTIFQYHDERCRWTIDWGSVTISALLRDGLRATIELDDPRWPSDDAVAKLNTMLDDASFGFGDW